MDLTNSNLVDNDDWNDKKFSNATGYIKKKKRTYTLKSVAPTTTTRPHIFKSVGTSVPLTPPPPPTPTFTKTTVAAPPPSSPPPLFKSVGTSIPLTTPTTPVPAPTPTPAPTPVQIFTHYATPVMVAPAPVITTPMVTSGTSTTVGGVGHTGTTIHSALRLCQPGTMISDGHGNMVPCGNNGFTLDPDMLVGDGKGGLISATALMPDGVTLYGNAPFNTPDVVASLNPAIPTSTTGTPATDVGAPAGGGAPMGGGGGAPPDGGAPSGAPAEAGKSAADTEEPNSKKAYYWIIGGLLAGAAIGFFYSKKKNTNLIKTLAIASIIGAGSGFGANKFLNKKK